MFMWENCCAIPQSVHCKSTSNILYPRKRSVKKSLCALPLNVHACAVNLRPSQAMSSETKQSGVGLCQRLKKRAASSKFYISGMI
mmetsp:Transcript_17494/g.51023  ORF Transcript_17494/g.51023 Transcript_17494/m.51023 type:complete len:85 (+) Transcript_17494:647-901(+)